MLALDVLKLAEKSSLQRFIAPRIRQYAMTSKLESLASDSVEFFTKSGKKVVKSGIDKIVQGKNGFNNLERTLLYEAKDTPWLISVATPKGASREFIVFDGKLVEMNDYWGGIENVNSIFRTPKEKGILSSLQRRINKIFNKNLGENYLREVDIPEHDIADMVRSAKRDQELFHATLQNDVGDFVDFRGM